MVSAAPIRAPPCASTLKWIATTSPWRRSRPSRMKAKSTAPPSSRRCRRSASIPASPYPGKCKKPQTMNAAAGLVEVRVPDMGNFKDVAVIDVLVKPGETIEPEAPLVTLETEKATMDVPSTASGVVEKVHVAKGGKVSTGDLVVTVRSAN